MARKLYRYKIWFSTSEGERIFRPVEAMNLKTAIKKAEEIINREKILTNDPRDWAASYAQQDDVDVRIEIKKSSTIPPKSAVSSKNDESDKPLIAA